MHERSLVATLLKQVEELMVNNDARRAVEVNVSIGEFAGVDRDLFELAFDELAAESRVGGAELKVVVVPLQGRCGHCRQEFLITNFKFQCGHCGSREVAIERGEALDLESVVLEQNET